MEHKEIISLLTEISANLAKIAGRMDGRMDGAYPRANAETEKLSQPVEQILQLLKSNGILNQLILKTAETDIAPAIDIATLLNAKQVMSRLRISERTLRRNSGEDGLIKPIRILKSNYYDPEAIEKLVKYFMK